MVINIIINCETLIVAIHNSKINRTCGYLIYIVHTYKIEKYIFIYRHISTHSTVKMGK